MKYVNLMYVFVEETCMPRHRVTLISMAKIPRHLLAAAQMLELPKGKSFLEFRKESFPKMD